MTVHRLANALRNQNQKQLGRGREGLPYQNYRDIHTTFYDEMTRGTCQWILKTPEYRAWCYPRGEGIPKRNEKTLFCYGVPGAGKTFVATAVIQDIRGLIQDAGNRRIGVAFIYFSRQDQETDHEAKRLLCNLLGQLIPTQSRHTIDGDVTAQELFVNARQVYNDSSHGENGRGVALEEIRNVLALVTAWYECIFVIVDALEECCSQSQLQMVLSTINSLQDASDIDIRFFATSTHANVPGSGFRDRKCLSLEIRAREEDVRRYLEDRMWQLQDVIGENSELQKLVKDVVVVGADQV